MGHNLRAGSSGTEPPPGTLVIGVVPVERVFYIVQKFKRVSNTVYIVSKASRNLGHTVRASPSGTEPPPGTLVIAVFPSSVCTVSPRVTRHLPSGLRRARIAQ